ncbi:MAG TPA: L,D-transpeptidase [Gemmatimonadaceae bacterium]|nr:L,D-transpeptidase [Gemmatimonadaceae bacterium]
MRDADDSPPARGWREFRHAHPRAVALAVVLVVALLAVDAWVLMHRARYRAETARLRADMTDVERRRTDMLIASDESRGRVMLELIRRQAQGDQLLHLSISVDSGVMYLERDGAVLRRMPVRVGADRVVGSGADTVHVVAPRGVRTVESMLGARDVWTVPLWVYADRGVPVDSNRAIAGALGASALLLGGGTVIYGTPARGPLADSAYVMPGAVRLGASDLKAIAPNLAAGMPVYFY